MYRKTKTKNKTKQNKTKQTKQNKQTNNLYKRYRNVSYYYYYYYYYYYCLVKFFQNRKKSCFPSLTIVIDPILVTFEQIFSQAQLSHFRFFMN